MVSNRCTKLFKNVLRYNKAVIHMYSYKHPLSMYLALDCFSDLRLEEIDVYINPRPHLCRRSCHTT
jgi:hypothetical protein